VSDERELLSAVIESPDDDTPRLVSADWLDDHGQADRAEFIRAQVELARPGAPSPRRREVAFRARTLLDRHRDEWLEPLGRFYLHDTRFGRGFVEMAGLMAGDFEEHAAELFAAVPLRRLWLTEMYGKVDCLRLIPADNRLTALDLCGERLDRDALEALAGMPNLGGLRELGLMFTELDDGSVDQLCGSPFFGRLSLIRCAGNPLSEQGRQRLRGHFGERVSFTAERDPDYLYQIQNERFITGFGTDFIQLLLYANNTAVQLVTFDHEGNLLGTAQRVVHQPDRPAGTWQNLQGWLQDAVQGWLKELGYQPATIRVKQFRFDGERGIHAFSYQWTQVLETPNHEERESARRWLDRWLAEGQFAYYFGGFGDWWLNAAGEVTDT
jgi:uncharacterized protein (TIGR02996 family)